MKDKTYIPIRGDQQEIPFTSAEEAWFWFVGAQKARNDGARIKAGQSLYPRPCEPSDIMKVINRLYMTRSLIMDHFKVLRHYGERQYAPDFRHVKEHRAFTLWKEAMEKLEPVLISKGIVVPINEFELVAAE